MHCDQPLLIPPPDNLFNVQMDKRGKRRASMVCIMTKIVNDAVITGYKKANCKSGYNLRKYIRPAMHGSGKATNPDGFPLARIATEVKGPCSLDEYKKPMPAIGRGSGGMSALSARVREAAAGSAHSPQRLGHGDADSIRREM
jgi:hypothetical protein